MENSTHGSKCARILFLTCQISTNETISGLFTFVFIGQFWQLKNKISKRVDPHIE